MFSTILPLRDAKNESMRYSRKKCENLQSLDVMKFKQTLASVNTIIQFIQPTSILQRFVSMNNGLLGLDEDAESDIQDGPVHRPHGNYDRLNGLTGCFQMLADLRYTEDVQHLVDEFFQTLDELMFAWQIVVVSYTNNFTYVTTKNLPIYHEFILKFFNLSMKIWNGFWLPSTDESCIRPRELFLISIWWFVQKTNCGNVTFIQDLTVDIGRTHAACITECELLHRVICDTIETNSFPCPHTCVGALLLLTLSQLTLLDEAEFEREECEEGEVSNWLPVAVEKCAASLVTSYKFSNAVRWLFKFPLPSDPSSRFTVFVKQLLRHCHIHLTEDDDAMAVTLEAFLDKIAFSEKLSNNARSPPSIAHGGVFNSPVTATSSTVLLTALTTSSTSSSESLSGKRPREEVEESVSTTDTAGTPKRAAFASGDDLIANVNTNTHTEIEESTATQDNYWDNDDAGGQDDVYLMQQEMEDQQDQEQPEQENGGEVGEVESQTQSVADDNMSVSHSVIYEVEEEEEDEEGDEEVVNVIYPIPLTVSVLLSDPINMYELKPLLKDVSASRLFVIPHKSDGSQYTTSEVLKHLTRHVDYFITEDDAFNEVIRVYGSEKYYKINQNV